MTDYGFSGRLKQEFPSQVIVDITERCNLSCIHCYHKDYVKTKEYTGQNMEKAINDKLVEEVRTDGTDYCQYLRYTADGEPLMHPEAYDFILHAIKDSGVPVTLTTNGKFINRVRMPELFDAGLFLIDISIDAFTPATYEKIRVGGSLARVDDNVMRMIKYRDETGSKTKIVVSFIEQPLNEHEKVKFESYWNTTGADQVVIRRLHSNAGQDEYITRDIHRLSSGQSRKPCVYPWERITIKPDGWIYYCPELWGKAGAISDYRTTTIRDVWNGEKYRQLRAAHILNKFKNFPLCERCPDWYHTKWPDEGRMYADMIEDFRREGK